MYRRNERGWFKHLDFLMVDLVALELSFTVAILFRFGFAGPADASLYGKVAVLLVIIHCCVVFFDESYHGILRRGYVSSIATPIDCVTVCAYMIRWP